ncbi:hypothetical protein ANO14919_069250 [Xylariales sp. No.14919]|nr:hypothetical protein ANO14919_069250 [Xylariales sp. No.14919]
MEPPPSQEQQCAGDMLVGRTPIDAVSPISTNLDHQSENRHTRLLTTMQSQGIIPRYPEEAGIEGVTHSAQDSGTRAILLSESSGSAGNSRVSSGFPQQQKPNVKGPPTWWWWWWWEIGAAVLSITSLVLLFVLLSQSDGRRLQSWYLPIQPNSLIAVLTTVAKTSMMVPVASCLSQLKWRHFISQPRPLDQFQVMDDASRGPWGSFVLLIKGLKIRTFLPLSLAFVTVVGLGFEPSAQQILDFPERTSVLANVSAEVGIATEYLSKGFVPGNTVWKLEPSTDLFRLQSSLIDGISGAVFEPNFNCPSDYCTWDDFTTLGICSAYQNLTGRIEMSCDDPDNPLFNCTYIFPDGKGSTIARNVTFGDLGKSQYLRVESFRSWFDSTAPQNRSGVLSAVKVTNYDLYRNAIPGIGFAYPEPPLTESYFTRFYWCAQTFRNVTAIPRQLSYGSVDVEELNEIQYDIGGGCSCTVFSSPTAGTNFTVDSTLVEYLMDYLENLLTQAVINVAPYSPAVNTIDLANYLYTANFQNLTANLAATISNQIRSADPGDNKNASTVHGIAHTKEIYIHVRWPWTILPAATVLITSMLLILAILVNVKHPLLKSSALALLFHGLDDDFAGIHPDQLETAEKIEHAAKSLRVHLAASGEDPLMKFRPQE